METLKAENKVYFADKARELSELCRNFTTPLSLSYPAQKSNTSKVRYMSKKPKP